MSSMMRILLSIFMSLLFTLSFSYCLLRLVPRFSRRIPAGDMVTSAVIVS